jgi:hypothetical protein
MIHLFSTLFALRLYNYLYPKVSCAAEATFDDEVMIATNFQKLCTPSVSF